MVVDGSKGAPVMPLQESDHQPGDSSSEGGSSNSLKDSDDLSTTRVPDSDLSIEALLHCYESDPAGSRDQLFRHIERRVRNLVARISRDFPVVLRWENPSDLHQNVMLKLTKALESLKPESTIHLMRLIAMLIRRELIDLSRKHKGPHGLQTNHYTPRNGEANPVERAADGGPGPEDMAIAAEFHSLVDQLPDDDQKLFDLICYIGCKYEKTAELTGMSERKVKRRYCEIRLALMLEIQKKSGKWEIFGE
jgi:RNA polymerase sigma factor (sigma-70 family)